MPDVPTVEYKVKKGDNLWNIVKDAGFPAKDWEKIYKAPYNEKFRKLRPDPNVIQPGDVLMVPKYNAAEMSKIVIMIDEVQSKLEDLAARRKKLQDSSAKIQKEREPDLKKIEQLKKDIATYEDIADSAAGECSDMYSCIGGGLASMNFANKAKAARKEIDAIKKKMDATGARKALEKMDKLLAESGKEVDKLNAEMKKLQAEWKKAQQAPY